MKYFLIFGLLFLLFCFSFLYFYNGEAPSGFYERVAQQSNPFAVHKDSAAIVWERAKLILDKRKLTIVGGNLQENDSMLFIPYYNEFHKGNSLRIERSNKQDSVIFNIVWLYSGKINTTGAKELALFIYTGLDKKAFNKNIRK